MLKAYYMEMRVNIAGINKLISPLFIPLKFYKIGRFILSDKSEHLNLYSYK